MDELKRPAGVFERAQSPIYFISSNPQTLDRVEGSHDALLVAVNEVSVPGEKSLAAWLDAGDRVLLDSGVFVLGMEHGRKHGLGFYDVLQLAPEEIEGYDELRVRYEHLVATYGDRLWGYVEIDQGGVKRKRANRRAMEARGVRPIPVFHPITDGWDYFHELASEYDRICVANVVQSPLEVRRRILATVWTHKQAHYPNLWVHVLGYTPDPLLLAYPMESADSSTFLSGVRWGVGKDRAMLANATELSPAFNYLRGSDPYGPTGHAKADRLAGYVAHMIEANWQAIEREGYAHG